MSLADRINQLLVETELSQADLTRITGATSASVTFWCNGETKTLKTHNALAIEAATGYSAKWLTEGIGPKKVSRDVVNLDGNPEYPSIRRVALKAQAGASGYAIEYMADDGPPIVFRADWYKFHNYKPEKMLALRVQGESMIPSLYQDDLIVVNTAQTEPKDGIAFVVNYEGEIVVKRLIRDEGQWWLSSDNADQRRYPRKKCNGGTEIIGEVVYRQTERI